jgi:hypothetical protein
MYAHIYMGLMTWSQDIPDGHSSSRCINEGDECMMASCWKGSAQVRQSLQLKAHQYSLQVSQAAFVGEHGFGIHKADATATRHEIRARVPVCGERSLGDYMQKIWSIRSCI